MKIGIITQPLGRNYGGMLQNWALQRVLLSMGHRPMTIIYQGLPKKYRIYNYWRLIFAYFVKQIIRHPRRNESMLPWETPPYSYMIKFVNTRIKKTNYIPIISSDTLKKRGLKTLILGSDQIWRPKYNEGFLDIMFCENIKPESQIKCIAYAASFGSEEWEFSKEETKIALRNIAKFSSISVREATAVNLCRDYLGREAIQVLDPTLLLSQDDYNALVNQQILNNIPDECIGVYFLDSNNQKLSIVENICDTIGNQAYYFGTKRKNGGSEYQGIEEWLASFNKCKFIITDSFHGMVFSIIYHKPFIAIANIKRGVDRFQSLLSLFNLNNRLMFEGDKIDKDSMLENIDWIVIDEKLRKLKSQSLSFLEQNLR